MRDVENDVLSLLMEEDLGSVDPGMDTLVRLEEDRQVDKLVMIPSESSCLPAARAVLASHFTNIYAEGHPSNRMARMGCDKILDIDEQSAFHRRYYDRRFYRGCDLANLAEQLAERRVRELFAATASGPGGITFGPNDIWASTQALSGAAANNAVYEALVERGDTVMGMDLSAGGHLTHGSSFNRSGKYYNIVSYSVSPKTGQIDYDELEKLAVEHKPRMIIGGASAYPWDIDWARMRKIADAVPGRAWLLADIAHPAGLVVAGLFSNPVGYADAVTFTTHKTLCGPRGAVILSTNPEVADRLDRAIFPGEQGGPHVNNIAAMAVSFALAGTEAFKELQRRTIDNAAALAEALQKRGLRLPYGGTNTHMVLVDVSAVKQESGVPLKGDIVSRLLDLSGIVVNKNTIPGDVSAPFASAIRLGTTWVTQRGLGAVEMDQIAEYISILTNGVKTFRYYGLTGDIYRGKIDRDLLKSVKQGVGNLIDGFRPSSAAAPAALPAAKGETHSCTPIMVWGGRAGLLLHNSLTAGVLGLQPGEGKRSLILNEKNEVIDEVAVCRLADDHLERDRYMVLAHSSAAAAVAEWLKDLSDCYVIFDPSDLHAKVEGPAIIDEKALVALQIQSSGALAKMAAIDERIGRPGATQAIEMEIAGLPAIALNVAVNGSSRIYVAASPDDARSLMGALGISSNRSDEAEAEPPAGVAVDPVAADRLGELVEVTKPYFIGQRSVAEILKTSSSKETFPIAQPDLPPRRTCLYEEHLKLTSPRNIVNFAGWEMPVWYKSIAEEHRAVRETAGLFDLTHMGVLEISGEGAARFLDLVATNYVPMMEIGGAQYSYVLDPNGSVVDDIFIYRRALDNYMVVVNAANAEKVLAWFQAVNSKKYVIDTSAPEKEIDAVAVIRDLKDPSSGKDRRVDIGLQGPQSLKILQKVIDDPRVRWKMSNLKKTEFVEGELRGMPVIISRTGYTGEDIGYEMYVHPDDAPAWWNILLEQGAEFGIKPTGLGSRDSARTEAGFPLYGHELSGPKDISPSDAGYGSYVKLHKPFFIGRKAFLAKDAKRTRQIVRFRMKDKGIRMIRPGDPVATRRGECIGHVTSCVAVDGIQVGMALVESRYSEESTPLIIFPLSRDARGAAEKAKTDLIAGDKVSVPEDARVLTRFLIEREII